MTRDELEDRLRPVLRRAIRLHLAAVLAPMPAAIWLSPADCGAISAALHVLIVLFTWHRVKKIEVDYLNQPIPTITLADFLRESGLDQLVRENQAKPIDWRKYGF